MSNPLRSRAIQVVFGGGVGATFAQTLIEWLTKEASDALGRTPEVLDVSKLTPGETYTVTVRPPQKKAERTAAARRDRLNAKLEASTTPSRSTIRTARRLARTQRRIDAGRGSAARRARLEAKEAKLGGKFDAATALSAKQQRLEQEIARLDVELAEHRRAALASVPRRRRRSSTRVLP